MLNINPDERLTIAGALRHSWVSRSVRCYSLSVLNLTQDRASQVANQGPIVLAQRLTQSLRNTGDLEIATPQRL
jgi:hypothetical protein